MCGRYRLSRKQQLLEANFTVLKGDKRIFVGTLLQTINFGDKRIAIFSVPK